MLKRPRRNAQSQDFLPVQKSTFQRNWSVDLCGKKNTPAAKSGVFIQSLNHTYRSRLQEIAPDKIKKTEAVIIRSITALIPAVMSLNIFLEKIWLRFYFIFSKKNDSFRAGLPDHCLGITAFAEQAKML